MKKNQWVHVTNSSLISGYKYFPEEKRVHVEFKNNSSMYAYFNVPAHVVNSISEKAPGNDIHSKIINGGYEYKKIN